MHRLGYAENQRLHLRGEYVFRKQIRNVECGWPGGCTGFVGADQRCEQIQASRSRTTCITLSSHHNVRIGHVCQVMSYAHTQRRCGGRPKGRCIP